MKQRSPGTILAYVHTRLLTACSGGGDGGSAVLTRKTAIYPRDSFATNANDNSASSHVVDVNSGRLKYIGKVASGDFPNTPSAAMAA